MASSTLIKLKTSEQVLRCIDLYLAQNDETFMTTSRELSYRNLFNKVRLNKFVRAVECDGEILAWLYADAVILEHTDYITVQQMYYGSSQRGALAVRCIKMLHAAMVEYAKSMGANYCTSAGSPYDSENVFAKILEKSGWRRRGYLAVLPLPHGGARLPHGGPFAAPP